MLYSTNTYVRIFHGIPRSTFNAYNNNVAHNIQMYIHSHQIEYYVELAESSAVKLIITKYLFIVVQFFCLFLFFKIIKWRRLKNMQMGYEPCIRYVDSQFE